MELFSISSLPDVKYKALGLVWGVDNNIFYTRDTNNKAISEMIEEAEKLDADAIVDVKFAAQHHSNGHYSITVSGTAIAYIT